VIEYWIRAGHYPTASLPTCCQHPYGGRNRTLVAGRAATGEAAGGELETATREGYVGSVPLSAISALRVRTHARRHDQRAFELSDRMRT
jgi:hypothetical protein